MHVCYLTKKEMQEDDQPSMGAPAGAGLSQLRAGEAAQGSGGRAGVRSVSVGKGLVPSPGAWQG